LILGVYQFYKKKGAGNYSLFSGPSQLKCRYETVPGWPVAVQCHISVYGPKAFFLFFILLAVAFPDSRNSGNPYGTLQCKCSGNRMVRYSVVPLCVLSQSGTVRESKRKRSHNEKDGCVHV
jgi:hypothetical protein